MKSWILVAALAAQMAVAAEPVKDAKPPKVLSGSPATESKPAGRSSTSKGTAKPAKDAPPPFKVTLSPERELTQALMELPANWIKSLFPNDDLVYVQKYDSDKVQGVYTFYQGKLNGPSARLYESGGMAALSDYAMSDRDGTLRLWEENKHRLLYAEYKRDKKHGTVCLFRDDLPWFIQEYDMDDLTAEYLVRWKEGASEVIPREKLASVDLRETAEARTKLTELQAELERNEADVKKALREWFREKDKEIKQKRVAKQSSVRHEEQRKKQQAAQKNLQERARNALRSSRL